MFSGWPQCYVQLFWGVIAYYNLTLPPIGYYWSRECALMVTAIFVLMVKSFNGYIWDFCHRREYCWRIFNRPQTSEMKFKKEPVIIPIKSNPYFDIQMMLPLLLMLLFRDFQHSSTFLFSDFSLYIMYLQSPFKSSAMIQLKYAITFNSFYALKGPTIGLKQAFSQF